MTIFASIIYQVFEIVVKRHSQIADGLTIVRVVATLAFA